MELGDLQELIEQQALQRAMLVAFLQCEISYSGRAETRLPRGDRLLIIKDDLSVLVHQSSGSVPVNYMKAGTQVTLTRDGEHLTLSMHNPKEKAWLNITVFRAYDAMLRKLDDGMRLDLAGNERDMSDYLRDHPEIIGAGFQPLSREEQTDVGFIDLFGHDGQGRLVVVECKRVTASLHAVDQLRRYVERVQQIKGTQHVTGVLAAPSITPNALEMLSSYGYAFCAVTPPKRLERWQLDQRRLGEF